MNTIIIIAVILTLLLIIGASQRKKLSIWFRSEAADIISKNTNTSKVAKLQLSDMKSKIKVLIDQASSIFALELQQKKEKEEIALKIKSLVVEAKAAKANDNITLAKEKLKLKLENEKQLELIEENIKTLTSSRGKIEGNIQKVKTYVAKNNIRLKGAETRKQVNLLLKQSRVTNIDGDTLEETIDTLTETVEGEEFKLEYIDNLEGNVEEEYSEKIDKEFETL